MTMTGRGLQLRMENAALVNAGFVKNEFVLAATKDEASRRAIEEVRGQLRQQAVDGGLSLARVDIEVDEVAPSLKFWKLGQQEGFVFFPHDEAGAKREPTH